MELSEAKLKWLLSATAGKERAVENFNLADPIMHKYGVVQEPEGAPQQESNRDAEEEQSHLTSDVTHGSSSQGSRLDRLEQMLLEMAKTIQELQHKTPAFVPTGRSRDALQPPDDELPEADRISNPSPTFRGEPVDGKEVDGNIDHASLYTDKMINGTPTDPASPNGSEATLQITMGDEPFEFEVAAANEEISVDDSSWELSVQESSPGLQPAPASIEGGRRNSGSIFNPLNPNIASQQSGNGGEKEEKKQDIWTFNNVFTSPSDEANT